MIFKDALSSAKEGSTQASSSGRIFFPFAFRLVAFIVRFSCVFPFVSLSSDAGWKGRPVILSKNRASSAHPILPLAASPLCIPRLAHTSGFWFALYWSCLMVVVGGVKIRL